MNAPSAVVERERKFVLPRGTLPTALQRREGWAALPAGLAPAEVSVEPTVQLCAVYYDTADGALAAARCTLRRRTGGHDAGWHLKRPAGADREELRVPLGAASTTASTTASPAGSAAGSPAATRATDGLTAPDPSWVLPAALRGAVADVVGDAPLLPVAVVTTHRTRVLLTDAAGRLLAELDDDAVTGDALRSGGRVSWHECEVELGGAPPAALDAFAAVLLAAGAEPSAAKSKVSQLLASAPAPQPPHRKAGLGAVLGAQLRNDVAAISAGLLALAGSDPVGQTGAADEVVHDLRVGCRRARSLLSTVRTVLDPAAAALVGTVRAELGWLAGACGAARDAEVQRDRLGAALAQIDPVLVFGPVAAALTEHLLPAEQHGRVAAVAAAGSDRAAAVLGQLASLAAAVPLTDPQAAARDVLPGLLRADRRRVLRRADAARAATAGAHGLHPAGEPGDEHPLDAVWHEVRKSAKQLRYAAEMATPVLGARARREARAAKAVQTALGEHQDSVVSRAVLLRLARHAAADPAASAFTPGLLYQQQAAAGWAAVRSAVALLDRWR